MRKCYRQWPSSQYCATRKKNSFSSVSPSRILNILRAVEAIVAARKKTRGAARRILLMGWMQRIRLAVMYLRLGVIKSAISDKMGSFWGLIGQSERIWPFSRPDARPNKFGLFLGLLANPNKFSHCKPMPDGIWTFFWNFVRTYKPDFQKFSTGLVTYIQGSCGNTKLQEIIQESWPEK